MYAYDTVDVLRGEICVELEPVYAINLGVASPLDSAEASLWALEDAQSTFSAMIYGWSFDYTPADRQRGIEEYLSLKPEGEVLFGDDKIQITDARIDGDMYFIWVDYRLNQSQKRRITAWNSSPFFNANAQGYGPLGGGPGVTDRRDIKKVALEDAAKIALRTKLRQIQKNRPHRASGFIALSKFPIYRLKSGRWSCVANFRIEIKETEGYQAF
ncbi:MAG: hypothetical protein Ta2F_00920 [Termitinemataceae bacterium]|nr:MAG: hypothetical protein Ta2F_00920 [Termitinemataceae bacterium]